MNKFTFIAVLFFVFLTACAGESSRSMSESPASSEKLETASTNPGGGGGGGIENGRGSGSGLGGNPNNAPTAAQVSLNQAENSQTAPITAERKIIRNADLQLETDAPEEAQKKIAQIVEAKGGFVVESTQSGSSKDATTRDVVTVIARVPAAKFEESLGEIRQTASRVVVETVKRQDVTEEFIDVEARLKAKKALEEQFLEIMKRSNSVADALNVQRELANVRGEIEQIEGRKRFLENQSSLSTIKITLKTPTAFSGSSEGFFYRLKTAIGTGFDAASGVLFFLITAIIALIPFFGLIVLPVYLLLRYWIRKTRKRKLANEIAREEIKIE